MAERLLISWVLFWLTASGYALAYDTEKEQYWEKEIRNQIKSGEIESLDANNHKFMSIFTPDNSGIPLGAIILLHDHGGHLDWPGLINPLRTRLPDFGWSTLSLQMPTPKEETPTVEYEPIYKEASARIQAGVVFLQAKGIRNIVLVGHGLGANMGAHYLSSSLKESGIKAYIGISMEQFESKPEQSIMLMLEKIRIPILDIFGMNDHPEVTLSAPDRIRSAKRGASSASKNKETGKLAQSIRANRPGTNSAGFVSFRQIKIDGADRLFTHQEDTLIKRIRGWLKRHAPGRQVKK